MFGRWTILLAAVCLGGAATVADYGSAFEVDLSRPVPRIDELRQKYGTVAADYDPHYEHVFEIGDVFDRAFLAEIKSYGSREKRLPTEDEEAILQMLSRLPRQYYQYVGPMLHQIPGMSEKVLNLPGIKETKNKFPERIAPQLEGMEGLEFLSPRLYYVLMPEAWPGNDIAAEFPDYEKPHPKVVYDKDFYRQLQQLVPPGVAAEKDGEGKSFSRSRLRTVSPDKASLLTSADVEAFIRTLDPVQELGRQGDNLYLLSSAMILFAAYERDEGRELPISGLKDLVNPCQRLVEKFRVIGKERELALAVSSEGLTPEEWAYTCDKTLKAYRAAKVPREVVATVRAYQRGAYDRSSDEATPEEAAVQNAVMQAMVKMYEAPLNDVLEVKKNYKQLHDKLLKYDNKLVLMPVSAD